MSATDIQSVPEATANSGCAAWPCSAVISALQLAVKVLKEDADQHYYAYTRFELLGHEKDAKRSKHKAAGRRHAERVLRDYLAQQNVSGEARR
jgi:hypothetical protein